MKTQMADFSTGAEIVIGPQPEYFIDQKNPPVPCLSYGAISLELPGDARWIPVIVNSRSGGLPKTLTRFCCN
jgi:hypothetical protein